MATGPSSCFVAGYSAHDGAGWWGSGSGAVSRRDGNELWRSSRSSFFVNSASLEQEDISARNIEPPAWVGTAVHGREEKLGQDHEDHDPV